MDPDKQASTNTITYMDHPLTPHQRNIASKGGKASSGSFEPGSERAREAGRKGGSRTGTGGGEDDAE